MRARSSTRLLRSEASISQGALPSAAASVMAMLYGSSPLELAALHTRSMRPAG